MDASIPSDNFKVQWNSSTSHFDLMQSNQVLESTTWNPYVAWDFNHDLQTTMRPELAGETYYTGTDLPGTSGTPTFVSSMQFQKYDNTWGPSYGPWSGPCFTPYRYSLATPGSGQFNYYTNGSTNYSYYSSC